MTTKITKWGNSYGLRISKDILKTLGIKEGTELEVDVIDGHIQAKLKHNPPKYSLEELVAQIPDNYVSEVVDWGKAVGKEIW